MMKMDPDYEYDAIAQNIFFPIFPYIAQEIASETGITKGKMLDAGCGGGHLGFAVLDLLPGLNGSFIDLDPAAILHARARAEERNLGKRSDFYIGNVEALPFEDESFDLIVSRGSIPFWDHQDTAFREFWRVLAKGGRTFIGGSLGSTAMRTAIQDKMQKEGMHCFGQGQNEISKAWKPEEYASFFTRNSWKHRCFCEPDEGGRWYILEK